jgi:hypothetical protein
MALIWLAGPLVYLQGRARKLNGTFKRKVKNSRELYKNKNKKFDRKKKKNHTYSHFFSTHYRRRIMLAMEEFFL